MTPKQIERLTKKRDKVEEAIGQKVDCTTLDLIYELVELEILLEQECNK